jgi:hypothetical protein
MEFDLYKKNFKKKPSEFDRETRLRERLQKEYAAKLELALKQFEQYHRQQGKTH